MRLTLVTGLLALSITGPTFAQVRSKPSLTLAAAEKLVEAGRAEAKRLGAPGGALAVVDDGGHLLAFARLDGSFPASADISVGKARTAARFKVSTAKLEALIDGEPGKPGRTPMLALKDFTPLLGGVPVIVDGEVIGAVGVSGAKDAVQDDAIAQAAAKTPQHGAKMVLTLEGARSAVRAIAAEASKVKSKGVIAVVGAGGELIALESLEGSFVAGGKVAEGKARTALLFRRATKDFEEIVRGGRHVMVDLPNDFTPMLGGVPILADGMVVGAVGVAGASTPDEDHRLAEVGAQAAVTQDHQVEYLAKDKVDAAFVKGSPLIERHNYKIHASHRDVGKDYKAEVHDLDTDIIYVLRGSATFVTGGTMSKDATTISPNEVRALRIEGGDTRRVGPGEVIVVPKGTPHWFKDVPEALDYYVVKSAE